MVDCEALIRIAVRAGGREGFQWRDRSCDPFAPWEILTVAEAFDRYAGIDLLATAPDPQAPDAGLLAREAERIGITPTRGIAWEDLFFRYLAGPDPPHLGMDRPTFLTDYPVSMAALVQAQADTIRAWRSGSSFMPADWNWRTRLAS